MSVRSVVVRLEAEVSQYVAGMGRSAAATEDVARRVVNTRQNIAENEQAMKDLGGSFLKVGAIGVAALGATAKAAMDWESAWAGVTKTVDGTPAQMDQLETSLRGLAKVLPSSHQDIAAVAEAAGQLGVKRADVAGFTKTMIDLGETTNLTSDEAATSIAQISNVMGTMARDGANGVERFGATLVALGNDGASTEKEIVAMAARLSGAMKLVGGSESDLLAMANAMASVGIEAQLGGGVMSRVMQRMYADVMEGGEGLQELAQVAGMSSKEFATAFETDPVRAVDAMIKGLAKVKDEGGNVITTMKDLGIKGTEETSVILRLAGAGDLLTDSLDLGAKAWAENTALAEEAEKRYATTEAKISIAWNKIKDASIDAGGVILPMLSGLVEAVGGLATGFGELPGPIQAGITVVALLATGSALLGGGLLVLIPKIAATRVAMQTLQTSGSRIPGIMTKVGKAAGIAAVALLAIGAAIKIANNIWGPTAVKVEEFGQALVGVWDNSASMDAVFAEMSYSVDSVGDALVRVNDINWFDGITLAIDDMFGLNDNLKNVRDSVGALDSTMADMANAGNFEQVGKQFLMLSEESKKSADEQGKTALTTRELLDMMPEYEAALQSAATAAGVQLTEQELLNFALGKMPASMTAATTGLEVMKAGVDETGVSIDAVVEDIDKFLEQLFALGLATMSSRDANAAYNESLRNITPTMEEIYAAGGEMGAILNANATDFDLTTEAGAKANAAFQDIAQNGMTEVETKAKEGLGQDALQEKLNQTYWDLVASAEQMGIVGGAAGDLARDVLGVPDGVSIETWMDDQARGKAQETKVAVEAIPGYKEVTTKYVSLFEQRGTPYSPDLPAEGPRDWYPSIGKKATGGAIYGPGTGTSDDVPLMASNGEHMFTAAEVQAMGGHNAVYKFRAALRAGGTSERLPVSSMMASSRQMASAGASPMSGSSQPGQPIHEGPTFNVEYYSYNAVAEPESRVTENISSHLALIGGL